MRCSTKFWWMQLNAAASIAHGGLTYDNAHKLVWGFDQSQNKRKLLGEEEKV